MPKVPSVAREIFLIKFKTKKFDLKKILLFFSLCYPRGTQGFPKKILLIRSSRLASYSLQIDI